MMRKIELLSPAKNIECGIAAINHGADAVYIGAPKFGARQAAGNSLEELESLIKHAHFFNAKVYVAVNTIIFDDEMAEVEKLINSLYVIGADAIIIQDMGILELELPPIQIHASTQTDNRTLEKVLFLEKAGIEQVVLARELSIDQIKYIADNTTVKLECFVHGALCVSYSGQCYMSCAINSRSANRGECGQPCRLPYTVTDENNKVIVKDKHLLSLKDLNQSQNLEALIDAGVTSLKIEGRLKDVDYVKNITAHYRLLLDEIIAKRDDLKRASAGITHIPFTPNPEKSFSRGFTSYYANGRTDEVCNMDTPKSLGEKIGKIKQIYPDGFLMDNDSMRLANGDGICFLSRSKELKGTNINKVVGDKIMPDSMKDLYAGASIFRNRDQLFNADIKNSDQNRMIGIDIEFKQQSTTTFSISIADEDGIQTSVSKELAYQAARNETMAAENIQYQLTKLGGTFFEINHFELKVDEPLFFQAKELNNLRREALSEHADNRLKQYKRSDFIHNKTQHPFPVDVIDYKGNVSNNRAIDFYHRHGVKEIMQAFELNRQSNNVMVMNTKHCILYALDQCKKKIHPSKQLGKLKLKGKYGDYDLEFDCDKCEMIVSLNKKK